MFISEIKVLNNLVLDGNVVGQRVNLLHRGKGKSQQVNGVFDIASDHLCLILEDFLPSFIDLSGEPINLVPSGKLFVSEDGLNVQELTYKSYAILSRQQHVAETDIGLKLLYNKYNKWLFDDTLPVYTPVNWSKRLTASAGTCEFKWGKNVETKIKTAYNFSILISTHYHDKHPDELIDTLVHEMIHVKLPGEHHGEKFMAEIERIKRDFDIAVSRYAKERATERKKITYGCRGCGKRFTRAKRINLDRYHCATCKSRLFLVSE